MGVDFKMAKVELQGTGALVMTGGKETVFIFLPEKTAQALEGKAYAYGPQDPGPRPRKLLRGTAPWLAGRARMEAL